MAEADFSEYRFTDLEDRFVLPCIGNDPYMAIGIPAEGEYAGTILSDISQEAVASTDALCGVIADRWSYMERQVKGGLPVHREHVEVQGNFNFASPDEYGISKAVYALSKALRASTNTAFGPTAMTPELDGATPQSGVLNGVFARRRFVKEFPYASDSSGNPTNPWVSVLDIYRLRTYVWGEGPKRTSKTGNSLPPAYNALKRPIAVFATAKVVFSNPELAEV